MSQEQKDRVEEGREPSATTPTPEIAPADEQTPQEEEVEVTQETVEGSQNEAEQQAEQPKTKKRGRRKTKLVNVEEILPHPSLWPLVLAFAVAITLFGILAGPIVLAVGVILVIVSIVGWVLERR